MNPNQRKTRNNLMISGTALIAVALFDVLKIVLFFVLDPSQRAIMDALFAESQASGWSVVAVVVITTLLEVILGCFIGASARAEARGKKHKTFYVWLAIVLAVFLAIYSIFLFVESFLVEVSVWSVIDAIVSFGLTGVVVYALVDIAINSLKNRQMNKALGATNSTQEEEHI